MKILHTADWHLGKRLHNIEMVQDHQLFFDWLIDLIKKEKINVVLISGDVFDLANPSSEARRLYYNVLTRINQLHCQVVITGGNHDSPLVLNAPKEVLEALNINVIGGLTNDIEELLIPLKDHEGKTKLVVAAIPFLRDSDLRKLVQGESHEDKVEAVKAGIKAIFDDAAQSCKSTYPDLDAIAMGHLFAHGATVSDSERDIQVGNLAGFSADQFSDYFKYIALGHIHRPQIIGKSDNIRYSGSPIALSFSEKTDNKSVVLLEATYELTIKNIPVPKSRQLLKVSGTLEEIIIKLNQLEATNHPLPALVEVEMIEDTYDPSKVTQLEDFLESFEDKNAIIAKHRISFRHMVTGTQELFDTSQHIDELSPVEVFEKLMQKDSLPEEKQEMLHEAFSEILETIYQQES